MSPQIITEEKGKKVGVFLPYKDYQKIMKELENAEIEVLMTDP